MKTWDCLPISAGDTKRARDLRRTVTAFLRGSEFAEFLLKPRPMRPKPANVNPKAVIAEYVPLAVLTVALARKMGVNTRVLRLTEAVANKMWWRHGPGVKRIRDKRRKNVPPEWYADIPLILRKTRPRINKSGRWQFDHTGLQRRLVVDLDEGGNPVMISYHGRKNPAK